MQVVSASSFKSPQALFGKTKQKAQPTKSKSQQPAQVQYGQNWYEQTREGARQGRTTREEIEYRREANRIANNGKERKDLYTANWDGAEYKGSPVNVLTIIAAVSLLAPIIGLVFAFQTYGDLWG